MTTNKLSRSKRETSEAGFDFALIILTSLFSLSFEFKHVNFFALRVFGSIIGR